MQSFIEDPDNPPDVIAHELLPEQMWHHVPVSLRVNRGMIYQFGLSLSDASLVNAGAGPKLRVSSGKITPFLAPNVLLQGEHQTMNISG